MIVWLASYPRSGNTLVRLMLNKALGLRTYSRHDDAADIGADAGVAGEVGHQFLDQPWESAEPKLRASDDLHLVKTHEGPTDNSPAIYVVRDGRASCRSFFHYLGDFPNLDHRFAVSDVVAGFTPFGSWSDHLDRWEPDRRVGTLLLKYEDLLADPATAIGKMAAFLGRPVAGQWRNNFDLLHEIDPRFFRAGAGNDPATALSAEDDDLFWAVHGQWMRRLGYPGSAKRDGAAAYRRIVSEKGRAFFNLSERTLSAERYLERQREARTAVPGKSDSTAKQRLRRLRREVKSLRTSAASAVDRAVASDDRAGHLQGRLAMARDVRIEQQLRLEEAARVSYAAQKQFARLLQEKQLLADTLAAAVVELHTRMKLLLSSRFLKLGWSLGFGASPYWAQKERDELTPLMETVVAEGGHKRVSKEVLRQIGDAVKLVPTDGDAMQTALVHLAGKGFLPDVVLDVGAAKGYWSVRASLVWPRAKFCLIDPLPQSKPALEELAQDPRFSFVLSAVGDTPGEVLMNVTPDPDGSSLLEFSNPDPDRQTPVTVETLDRLIESGKIPRPNLVKMDVQGFELKALAGGQLLMDSAEVFIIEANFYQFMPGCPRLHELVAYMAARDFYPFDFAGQLRRPYHNDLGQVDIVFVRSGSSMSASNRWVESEAEQTADAAPTPAATREPAGMSVVICTRDPWLRILDRALDALELQTLSKAEFDVVVVDNGSTPALDEAALRAGRTLNLRVVTEPTPGLSDARCAGIAATTAEILVFVDDDNFLDADYLENARRVAGREPRIGLFGGISKVELESPVPKWKEGVLPYLGIRDHGPAVITAFADYWGEWEPIGAGMVARREVAEKFVAMYRESAVAQMLGRRGRALLSGEDSLFARAAHRVGYACSYQPSLKLTHFIKRSRMRTRYLVGLMRGHGRSFVLLNRAVGKPTELLRRRTAVARLIHRLKTGGRAGAITWFWDIGYAMEKRTERGEMTNHEIRIPE